MEHYSSVTCLSYIGITGTEHVQQDFHILINQIICATTDAISTISQTLLLAYATNAITLAPNVFQTLQLLVHYVSLLILERLEQCLTLVCACQVTTILENLFVKNAVIRAKLVLVQPNVNLVPHLQLIKEYFKLDNVIALLELWI